MPTYHPQTPGNYPGQPWQTGQPGSPLPVPPLGTTTLKPTINWAALAMISKALRIFAWILAVGGAIGFLVSIIGAISAVSAGNPASPSYNPYQSLFVGPLVFVAFSSLILGSLGLLYNLALSEMIGVFLAIEWNTSQDKE